MSNVEKIHLVGAPLGNKISEFFGLDLASLQYYFR